MDDNHKIINQFINHLTPGKVIDLQLGGLNGVRIKPVVIGLDIGNYLLIKLPAKLKATDYSDVLITGNIVVLRYIIEGEHGECIAFSTTIKHVINIPERLLFLKYPDQIENRQLRAYQREKTYLAAQISLPSIAQQSAVESINGYIVDISTHGCQFSFNVIQTPIKISNCPVYITITIINCEKPLLVKAHIKNSRTQNGQMLVGTMFDESSLDKISMLLEDMAIRA